MEHSKSFDTLQYYSENYGIGDDVHVDDICGLTIGPVKDMGLDFELQEICQTVPDYSLPRNHDGVIPHPTRAPLTFGASFLLT